VPQSSQAFFFAFYLRDIHSICLWDEESVPRMKEELEATILDFIHSVQEVAVSLFLKSSSR